MKKSEKPSGIKKGKPSWKPASLNEFEGKEEGFRYRMVNKDPKNLSKKTQEGWETIGGITSGSQIKHEEPGRINDAKPLTSVVEGNDWLLMRLPEEKALERDAYFENESDRRVKGLTSHIKQEMRDKAGGASVHGEITISSRKGTQTI